MKHIRATIADGIATITLDAADEAMNVISPEWSEEFANVVDSIRGDAAVRGAIITSGKASFMVGADLKGLARSFTVAEAQAYSLTISRLLRRLETCGKPVVAAVNGLALGGGLELALACHGRIVVDSAKPLLGLPEVNVGLLPGAGGTQRLPRMIGIAETLDLLLSGSPVTPAKALALGLVDAIVPEERLLDRAREWLLQQTDAVRPWDRKGFQSPESKGLLDAGTAALFGMKPAEIAARTFHCYPAPAAILSAVFEGVQLPMDKALAVESKYFAKLLSGDVARNIIRTMFVAKGQADKLAARPRGIDKARFGQVGVLGAGMMGAGIAYAAAVAGSAVVLLDRTQQDAESGKDYSRKLLDKDVERGRRTRLDADAILARITPTADFAELSGCSLVVEAVFEDAVVKADVIRRAESILPADAVFASNTSTLPISGLAGASKRPESFIGLHFFSPVERMPLVETIVGKETSQETIAHALDFVAHLRKTPIVVRDSRGFYTSRVFLSFIHEGMAMLAEGIAPALIENAARFAGMPVGPLAVTDEVSLALPLKIVQQAESEIGRAFERPAGYDVLVRMTGELGRHGRKADGGFYDYSSGGQKRIWPQLTTVFPARRSQPTAKELGRRLLCVQALEAARCMEERVLANAADADLGSILGVGFPSYTGGTLSYIDTMGIAAFVEQCDGLAQRHGRRFLPSDWLRKRASEGALFHH